MTSSVFETIAKLRSLLSREEKIKWLGIVGFAMVSSLLEVITATIIVIFAQVLNEPELGSKYFSKVGITGLSPSRIIFYLSVCVGLVYFIKNSIAGCEIFFQNFTIQKMAYGFRKKILERYANIDYGFYLTRNSSHGLNVISSDIMIMFQGGMLPLSMIVSEIMVIAGLIVMIVFMNPTLAVVVMMLGIVLGGVIHKILSPRFYKWGQRLQATSIEASQNLHQFFHGFKEIVLLGRKDYFIESYNQASKRQAQTLALQTASANIPRIFLETVFIGIFVVAIAFLCGEDDSPSKIMGILGGYLYTAFRLMPGLNRIISQLNAFKAATPCINRSYDEYN